MTLPLVLRHGARALRGAALLLACSWAGHAAAQVPLADQPVFATTGVPGNLALALSVEFPTAVSVAHIDWTYDGGRTYLGYFDPNKCYGYQYSTTNDLDRYFFPSGAAISRACTGAQAGKWSGNFLNWATMQTIDPFRWALTGGYRVVDTATLTVLERAWASGQGGTGNFPDRSLGSNALVTANTPFAWTSMAIRNQGLGNRMRITVSGDLYTATPTDYNPAVAVNSTTVYEVVVRVRVCDSNTATAGPLESNCTQYPNGNFKPTGLLQQYASKIRYSAFGYLNDSDLLRDGGVLRARQKFVGPQVTVPGGAPTANAATEWDANTGVFALNPDASDASATATLFGVPVSNSGVINYLNKFGQITPGGYKTFDPVGELYYAAVRYFKNLGNVPSWSAPGAASTGTKTTWVDGFPVIATWDDPIQWSCQKNFILGIGDVNSWADKNLPGPTLTDQEPTKPSAVTADTTVNAVTATNKVGQLHGMGVNLGTNPDPGGCCGNNYHIAGLAYDANTVDIRPDDATKPQTRGKQTIQTYWLDVLEYQYFKPNNQYYLAAKYGGFKVPSIFDPYARTADIPQAWWTTSGETVGGQPRPDNYFVASAPDTMVQGLTRAFASIASQLRAFTTSFATSVPQVVATGNASYSTQYDAGNWTGELSASTSTFDTGSGEVTTTTTWSLSTRLAAQLAGTGWNTNRVVLTTRNDTNVAVPFRIGNLSATQRAALDTAYRAGDDSSDYLNYLRGDTTHEAGSTAAGSSQAYRARERLLGDIVNAKPKPVGPPSSPYSSAANPGYGTFRSTWANRTTMVYVGANDGMLRGVDGSLSGATAGREVFAYVPGMVIAGPTGTPATNGLASRGNPSFTHRNFVDGPIGVYDIDFARTFGNSGTPDWRSVLVAALGKGGKGYVAIDVTDPAAFNTGATIADKESNAAAKVLWEFTHADLGYTYGEPAVVKTRKHGWVLIFGSGYNNTDGRGYFFVVNPRNGALLEKIEAREQGGVAIGTAAAQAGLAQVQAFVLDRSDGTADAVYAGDLLGNLWRLDVRGTGTWPAPVRLATLTDINGNAVPFTTRPTLVVQPVTNRRWITIGSGRLLDTSDVNSTQPQGFYAILDGTGLAFNTAASLPAGVSFPFTNSRLRRLTDLTQPVTLDTTTPMGWWIDLGAASGTGLGWRLVTEPVGFFGSVSFAPMLPNGDACSPSGTSRVFSIDLGTGQSRLLNTDGTRAAFLTPLTGVVTDLRETSVNGVRRLIAGDDAGNVTPVRTDPVTSAGLRRLNWRELPLTD